MDTALLAPSNHDLFLPQETLAQLQSQEDYENAFLTVAEQLNNRIWWIADLVASYARKFPRYELDIYKAGQQMSQSSYRYYLRTAIAFPPETRNPMLTFSHHYQASWADEFNSKKKKFVGDKRFTYLAMAADDNLSSRALANTIAKDKELIAKPEVVLTCQSCYQNTQETIREYKLYTMGKPREKTVVLYLHPSCKDTILTPLVTGLVQAQIHAQ